MPTGTPYHSYILPYRIRVDDFATPLNQDPSEAPLLHLLTHTHSDHINGLSARSFGYKVFCSEDAKQMLLRHEVYAERELQALELRSEKIRTYSHLRVDPLLCPDGTMYYTGSRDLLVCRYHLTIFQVNAIVVSLSSQYANKGGTFS
jgi:DNA cross-link repair 1C protein